MVKIFIFAILGSAFVLSAAQDVTNLFSANNTSVSEALNNLNNQAISESISNGTQSKVDEMQGFMQRAIDAINSSRSKNKKAIEELGKQIFDTGKQFVETGMTLGITGPRGFSKLFSRNIGNEN